LGDDGAVVEALGLPFENKINNGGFNVVLEWMAIFATPFSTLN
jgi:hypothetical protein